MRRLDGEKITALDGEEYTLASRISIDEEKPVAIAELWAESTFQLIRYLFNSCKSANFARDSVRHT